MRRRNAWLIAVAAVAMAALCCVAAANMVSAEHEGLLHVLQTDQYQYVLHDSVSISYTVTNVSGDTMYILFSLVGCPLWNMVYSPGHSLVWSDPMGCVDEAGWRTLVPDESLCRYSIWDMTVGATGNPISHPGLWIVESHIAAYDPLAFGVDLLIEILDPTSVPEDALPKTWTSIKAMCR
ncbi:MAG: hypothetical protein KAW67_05910 [Candidatus Eisenbacteria sp.]|nr:hypothetical protein [Candidatus Eisenbacteria bacterium]